MLLLLLTYLKDSFHAFDHQDQDHTQRTDDHDGAFHDDTGSQVGHFDPQHFHDEILVNRTGQGVELR